MKILVVDDDSLQREMLTGFLKNQGFDVESASDGGEALRAFSKTSVQLVLLDHRMPDMNGDEVLARMKAINPFIRAIMITAYGAVQTAVNVMQLGADDFLEKPVNLTDLLEKIRHIEQDILVVQDTEHVVEKIAQDDLPLKIIGSSTPMKELLSMVRRVSGTPWSVLIRGETGTGKELVARLIHELSPRMGAPFIELNCAAVPENLFESELFGHEKGSFTGASSQRKGRFEVSQNGTLFLDEVGELPVNLQAKLLRALQEKRISRVGSEKEIEIDVRVLAATNRDLKKMIADGGFREDLYFRLNVLEINVPPLRKRKEDIPQLVDFFLEKYGLNDIHFAPEAMDFLVRYDYPGNVRELEHLVQRTVTLSRGNIIRPQDLPPEIREARSGIPSGDLTERLAGVEREMLLTALRDNDWVQTKAAESLGISERVLRYKMEKAGIRKGESS
ncbi:MAG: sigma-54-dependent Fis family transcriptional regulator [Desulfobulbaceae bacterium]|uniref:Sigma-54-dependent Fis family transcriptional regulator n=1 Tax=Candidatus Desulfobia pelagia TaxID=2841692 RepID=A0A8J6NEI8_9BACT|nr:sigma-54-dependent Fis family transcriptional regulator [Candidatus Desulfobia pelagia]